MLTLVAAIGILLAGQEPAGQSLLVSDPLDLFDSLDPLEAGDPFEALAPKEPRFAVGAHLGWFQMQDAEDGELFYGLHGRAYFAKIFAVEASIDFAESDFIDDDAELTFVPVQISGMVFLPLPGSAFRPYGMVGVGWYFTDVDYSGDQSLSDDESENTFGFHLGGGVEMLLGDLFMLHADLRYIIMDEPELDNNEIDGESFDYWQLTIGGSIAF